MAAQGLFQGLFREFLRYFKRYNILFIKELS